MLTKSCVVVVSNSVQASLNGSLGQENLFVSYEYSVWHHIYPISIVVRLYVVVSVVLSTLQDLCIMQQCCVEPHRIPIVVQA